MGIVNGPDVQVDKEDVGSVQPDSTESFTTRLGTWKDGSWTVYAGGTQAGSEPDISYTVTSQSEGTISVTNSNVDVSYDIKVSYSPEPKPFVASRSSEDNFVSVDSNAEGGVGGDDMDAWSLIRRKRLNTLSVTTFSNESSYELTAAVVDSDVRQFRETWDNTERTFGDGEVVQDGAGGGNMSIWTKSRKDKIDSLLTTTFSNQSSFDIPPAVVGSSSNPPRENWKDTERFHGISVSVQAFDASKSRLTGTGRVIYGGSVLDKIFIDGLTTMSSEPPTASTSGDDIPSEDIDFYFVPDADAVDYREEGISYRENINVKYGSLKGKITDANGDPVSDEPVAFPNVNAEVVTDENGEYELNAGAGELEFSTLFYTLEGSVTISQFSSVVRDFQFPGMEVEYVLPNGNAVKGANVHAGQLDRGSTGDAGKVIFNKMPVATNVEFVLENVDSKQRTTPQEGGVKVVRFESGAGVQGKVYNEDTLNKITDTPIRIVSDASISAKSKGGGNFAVGTFDTGTVRVDVGFNDPRYQTESIVVGLSEGEVKKIDVPLSEGFVDSTY